MNVPLLDLKAQYATLKNEMLAAVSAVMDSQYFINGPAVKELEGLVAKYSDCKSAVGVSSGTDALLCALMTLGIGPGDEVISTPFTFFATAGCIARTGAKPVFVDIDPATFNINPALIEKAVTPKTKAIMPVHLFGQLADMDPIMAVANKHKLAVIEDAAQAIGATQKGKKAGSIGTAGCFSFFPSKNLGGLGDGGMIVTQDAELGEKLAVFRNHGSKPKYYHKWVGGNFRLDTIQAAGLIVKLKYLEQWSAKRRANAARYTELLAGESRVVTPKVLAGNVSIFNQYCIRVPKRNELQAFLKEQGIGTEVYYPVSMHEQECFKSLGHRKGDFPAAEKAEAEVLALPIYPELTDEQIVYVAGKVKEFVGKN
ncbi:MAG: DegT/DnrJ/EryC1/StrS family aminotransferase [Phycisphaerae bacterium]|nr:DegT/DnrJ/EryC1/StrS family aminotransferase [Phycisphaerae bacterium]